ncbi:MAG: hypothetical protein HYR56_25225 [Acidobacteria bacterium]|nr:hypothetical protein [Acidobacteriota bacterium]MBI3421815.1 hypothetical protein [Acidobacteriota bacterium]
MQRIIKMSLFIALLLTPLSASAAYTGTQAIGFANWTSADVTKLANDYAQTGGDLELSFLPYEFNAGNPFGNATAFTQSALPRLNGRLKLTAYLWFHNAAFDWAAFRRGNEASSFRARYLQRVAAFDAWAKGLEQWAAARGLGNRFDIVLCPYLEDNCTNLTDYQNLLTAIRAQQQHDAYSSPMRRSPGGTVFRVTGLALEMHGRYDSVRGQLQSGDVFSNDGNFVWLDAATVPGSRETSTSFSSYGTPTSCGEFIGKQRTALATGVSVLYWRPGWNGLPGAANPADRHNLTPLTGANGTLENYALLKVLRSR